MKTTSERIKPQAVHRHRVRKSLPMKPRENSLTFHPCSSPTHRHRQVRRIHRWMAQEPNWGFSTPQNYPVGKSPAYTPTQGRSITVYQLCRSSQISAKRCVFSNLTVPGTRHKRVFPSQELRYYAYLSGNKQSPVPIAMDPFVQTPVKPAVTPPVAPAEESLQGIVAQPGYEKHSPEVCNQGFCPGLCIFHQHRTSSRNSVLRISSIDVN